MLRWSIEKTGGKEEGRKGKRRKRVGKEQEKSRKRNRVYRGKPRYEEEKRMR